MSRVDYGGGGVGFFGFLLRFIASAILVWILTVIFAAVILIALEVKVDVLSSFLRPAALVEGDLPLGLASLVLGWFLSMLIVYHVIWRGLLS